MNSIQPNTLLPILIFAPAVIGLLLALVFPTIPRPWRDGIIQKIGLATAVISLLAGFWLAWQFDTTQQGFQFVTNLSFGAGTIIPMTFSFGLDGLSLTLIILTAFLIVLALLSGEQSLHQRKSGFVISLLILESFLLGVFGTLDIFLLYVFFEAMLIPMFIVIGIWGGENRTYAAFKFFLYTLAGSVLMLVALIYLYQQAGTSNLPDLLAYVQQNPIALNIQRLLWFAFFASFAVKVPLWPFHTWLPDAHVQAPTGGSVLLAGIQLKMGAYGFLRLSMPLLPQASQDLAWVLAGLAIISIIYTSLIALAQQDMKKLIAYSSVAHMGVVILGMAANNLFSLQGAITQMISHGLTAAALFLCVGVLYDRFHTRDIASLGGLVRKMPCFSLFFLFFVMASIGLPGTSGFVGEFLALMGSYRASPLLALLAGTGTILGAWYSLRLYRNVMLGDANHPDTALATDLRPREAVMLTMLAVAVLWIGLQPNALLHVLEGASQTVLSYSSGLTPQLFPKVSLPVAFP